MDKVFTNRMPKERALAVLARMANSALVLLLPAKYSLALDVAVRAVAQTPEDC